MTQNWAAVARAINEHMTGLGLNQRELADRSGVALTIVKELRHNTVQRRRSGRTLEALSRALDLHPRHLSHILIGHQPPDTTTPPTDDIPLQLTRIEDRLNELADRIEALDTKLTHVPLLNPPHH